MLQENVENKIGGQSDKCTGSGNIWRIEKIVEKYSEERHTLQDTNRK